MKPETATIVREAMTFSDAPAVADESNATGSGLQGDTVGGARANRVLHISDYAICCNRLVSQSRNPHDRIFQLGGRRRLRYASALAVQQLGEVYLGRPKNDLGSAERVSESLAALAFAIADGVFRKNAKETAARLTAFLIGKIDIHMAKMTLSGFEKTFVEKLSGGNKHDVQEFLEGLLIDRPQSPPAEAAQDKMVNDPHSFEMGAKTSLRSNEESIHTGAYSAPPDELSTEAALLLGGGAINQLRRDITD